MQFFGIGLGAMFGGIGGLVLFLDWFKRGSEQRRVSSLRKRYPRARLNKDFKIVSTSTHPGWWFIVDNRTKKRHWITSLETLSELGYSTNDGATISTRIFNTYDEGLEIKIEKN